MIKIAGEWKHTEEEKKKMREAKEGRYNGKDNPFFGKCHSEENKEKDRKRQKERWQDPEFREVQSNLRKKENLSVKTLEKMRVSAKRRIKEKGNPFQGHHHTEESKEKIRKAKEGCSLNLTEEQRKRRSEVCQGEKNPNFRGGPILVECAFCHKMIYKARTVVLRGSSKRFFCNLKCKGNWQREERKITDETRKKIRKASKKNWQDPKYRERGLKILLKASRIRIKPNKAELKLNSILQEALPDQYALNVKAEVMTLGGKIPDFVNINGKKKVIELYGDYHHRDEKLKNGGDGGAYRKNLFARFGFGTLIVWESELREKRILIRKIKRFNRQENQLQYHLFC